MEVKLYNFTNKEYKQLQDAVIKGDYVEQMFCLQVAQMRKNKENEKIRNRVNKMRKINKHYGRPKQKD